MTYQIMGAITFVLGVACGAGGGWTAATHYGNENVSCSTTTAATDDQALKKFLAHPDPSVTGGKGY